MPMMQQMPMVGRSLSQQRIGQMKIVSDKARKIHPIYANDLATVWKTQDEPMAFNDGIYYNGDTSWNLW